MKVSKIWELTENTKVKFGITLTQIKRVGSDELGGWIVPEKANLGNDCWIGWQVEFYRGVIRGGEIRGGAKIESSDDILEISPIGSEDGVFTAYKCEIGFNISRGCFTGTPLEFKAAVKKTHGTRKNGKIYMHILQLCEMKFGKKFWDETNQEGEWT